ncbi:MAG TPA: hypothetical protein VNU84_07770 [Candidatus Acidoferrum sp.]|jgi:hypothetical protein|nr:hypothetical protein [Candidatus Acidoferrum sp.]
MSQDPEAVLRKSLNEVDRSQKWQIGGLVIFFFFFVAHTFAFIGMVHHESEASPITHRAVAMGIFSDMLLVIVCAFGVTIFMSRMTKKILKAIELSSKP